MHIFRRRELRLHGGVHKTGSTFLQFYLRQNRPILARHGIAFHDPKRLRDVTSHFFRAADPALGAEQQAELSAKLREKELFTHRTTILSHENMIGVLPHFAATGQLYSTAPAVLALFRDILPQRVTSVHLCIRDFAGFLASAYVEVIRARPFQTFEQFIARADLDALSWQPLFDTFAEVFPDARIEVWTHDAFRRDSGPIIDRLCGAPVSADLPPPDVEAVRPSASARAVEEAARIASAHGPEAALDAIAELERTYRAGPAHPRFDPWTASDRAALTRVYQDDLAAIRARADITLIE